MVIGTVVKVKSSRVVGFITEQEGRYFGVISANSGDFLECKLEELVALRSPLKVNYRVSVTDEDHPFYLYEGYVCHVHNDGQLDVEFLNTIRTLNPTQLELLDMPKEAITKEEITKTKEGNNSMSKVSQQLEKNKSAALAAAKITAGKAINNKLMKLVKPKLPMMMRGYTDSPFAKVVLANATGLAIQQFLPDNKKANKAAELMLNAAALQMLESFDLEGMLDELLKGAKIEKVLDSDED